MLCFLKWSQVFFVLSILLNFVLSNLIHLNNDWSIQNANHSIELQNISLPSGVYSALEYNNVTESILISYNDVNLRWIAYDNWTYTLNFGNKSLAYLQSQKHVILTVLGIDTLSNITLNNEILGLTDNMFVRYRYDIKQFLKNTGNTLKVEIMSPVLGAKQLAKENSFTPPECPPARYNGECHMNFLRKMQASFSWDWGLAAPSLGIWKSVMIEYYESAFVRDITYELKDVNEFWNISAIVYLEAGMGNQELEGTLMIEIIGLNSSNTITVSTKTINGEAAQEITLQIKKSNVELWWPNGYGKQKLYNLRALWEGKKEENSTKNIRNYRAQKIVRIGFRTIELVQETAEGGLTFYFKVNNEPIFMKGSNWIPSEIRPEINDKQKMRFLLKSAKQAHFNMIRVWGGGVYEHDYFYSLADTYGILIFQDMMFACAMYPVFPKFLESVKEEVKQNVRRLQSHPSVAMYAANNENEAALRQNWYSTSAEFNRFADEYRTLYVETIKSEVEKNDKSRECLTSSPSNGKKTETEDWISKDPQDWHYGDIHYYNYLSDGWDPNIYPKPRFSSEYGFQSFPSLSSWKTVTKSDDNLTELIDHRQHSPLGNGPMELLIIRHLPKLNQTSENYLETLIYFSQISQAMVVKIETEVYRAERGGLMGTMGALYWQLNDVWIAPSWSSIDFEGQFKILQYWAKEFLAPLAIIGHIDKLGMLQINLIRDSLGDNETFSVILKVYKWSELTIKRNQTWAALVQPNSVKFIDSVNVSDYLTDDLTKDNSFIELTVKDKTNKIRARNLVYPQNIKNCIGIIDPNIQLKIVSQKCNLSVSNISLEVRIKSPAIFIYLQLNNPSLFKHTFNKNGFTQTVPIQTIYLEYDNINCATELTASDVTVMTVNQFMI